MIPDIDTNRLVKLLACVKDIRASNFVFSSSPQFPIDYFINTCSKKQQQQKTMKNIFY